eukprot:6187262-Pleurochrysis_carterae.AAC.3
MLYVLPSPECSCARAQTRARQAANLDFRAAVRRAVVKRQARQKWAATGSTKLLWDSIAK